MMRYIQHSLPNPNKKYDFVITNFAGGLNNRAENLPMNQCSNVKNMAFMDDAVMEKRKGTKLYKDYEVNGGKITFLDEFNPYTGDPILLYADDTNIYANGEVLTSIFGLVTGANFSGKYYFVDGEHFRVYGKFAQETTTYEQVKGTPVEENIVLRVSNPPETYTPLGTEHTQGKTVIDYDTSTIWYEPCKLEMEDPYKNANVLPERPKYLVAHDGRLYVSGLDEDDDNVFISDIQQPLYFPSTTAMQVSPNSDKVLGLVVFDDAVLVSRKKDIHAIRGKTNNPTLGLPLFELIKLNTHTGMANHNGACSAHNYLFYLGSDGQVYALGSVSEGQRVLLTQVISKDLDLFKMPIGMTNYEFERSSCVFYKDEWYLNLAHITLVYSYRHKAWTLYSGIGATSFYVKDNELIWGDEKGRIATFSEDYLDFGEPYGALWKSGILDMDSTVYYKHFKEVSIVAHTFEEYLSKIRLKVEVDYVDINDSMEIEGKVAVFGKAVFGDRFISRNINYFQPFLINRRGKQLRYTLFNSYDIYERLVDEEAFENYIPPQDNVLVKVESTGKYFLRVRREWVEVEMEDLNQPMRVYQLHGDYEMRTKR